MKTPWSEPVGRGSRIPPVVIAETWPPEVVAEMEKLWQRAREEIKDDPVSLARFGYWMWSFEAFLEEVKEEWAKAGLTAPQ